MAFYFRKFGRSCRILPATKSMGFSTRTNEGDKLKEEGTYSKALSKRLQEDPQPFESSMSMSSLPTLSPSALVPRSVRDMALVLLPRFKEDNRHRSVEDLESALMDAAKSVPFTCDDILAPCLNIKVDNDTAKDFVVSERFTVDIRLAHDMGFMGRTSCEIDDATFCSRNQPEIRKKFGLVDKGKEFGIEKDIDTLLMNRLNFNVFDGFTYCAKGNSGDKSSKSNNKDGPSAEQLHSAKEKLENSVQFMFTNRYDYSILHKNVVFENQLFGENIVRKGQTSYALELLRMRLKIHSRFSSTAVEVLNVTTHEDKGMIRIHWRLKGLPQTELLKFWRFFQSRDEISKDDWQWFEAFSYFHIDKDGLVHHHKIDRMLPGNEEPDKLTQKLGKLLVPKPLVS